MFACQNGTLYHVHDTILVKLGPNHRLKFHAIAQKVWNKNTKFQSVTVVACIQQ